MRAREQLGHEDLRSAVVGFRDALRAHQERLNRLNVYPVPDGDTGTNMALTLESVVAEMEGADDLATTCRAIGHGSLMGARGNSGVILSQMLRGLCERLGRDGAAAGPEVVAEALAAASTAAYGAVLRPVEGTILTVAREAADAAVAAASAGRRLVEVLDEAAAAAREAVDRTPQLLPVLAEAGVVDAGGAGLVLFLDALLNVVDGRPLPPPPQAEALPARSSASGAGKGAADADGPRYEVMYLLEAPEEAVEALKATWAGIGDSIVVVGGDGLWNCHIHTDDIGSAIEAGVEAGRPRRIAVTDLAGQVEEERWVRRELAPRPERVATAVVAVGAGPGIVHAFRSLGAQEVVAGGQSMNPSTAELLEAVRATHADAVIVLPNNRNIVPVAGQAAAVAGGSVRVLPTRGLVEGLAALMAYDAKADVDANLAAMAAAVGHVVSGQVTRAVRDAGAIREGDWLGLAGDEVAVAEPDLVAAACALLDRLVAARHELVTVIEGEDATDEGTARIGDWLAAHRPDVAVDVQRWLQPMSAYLFSIE